MRVPFGRGERIGIVVDHPAATDVRAGAAQGDRRACSTRAPTIGTELLLSLRWAAEYYHHPFGAVLSHALPGLLREGRAIDEPPEPAWQLTALGRAQDLARLPRTRRQQARALAALRDARLDRERAQGARRRRRDARAARGQGLDRAGGAAGARAALLSTREPAGRRARAHRRSARRARRDRSNAGGA